MVPSGRKAPVRSGLVFDPAAWVIWWVFQKEDCSPPWCVPVVLVIMTLSNAAAPKSASGKNALVDVSKGASLIASALLRRQLTPDGQDRVAVNDRPSVRSEKLTVNRWSEGLKKTCMLIASPGCTAMLGKRGPSGNICQNGASTGVVLFSQPATS